MFCEIITLMKREMAPFRTIGLAFAVVAGSYAITGCADTTPPEEVQQLRSAESVDAARAGIRAEQTGILREDGLLGFHELQLVQPLRDETTSTKSEGSISGSNTGLFILIAGGSHGKVKGEFDSETTTDIDRFVRLAWRANNATGDILVSDFPIENIIVRDATESTGISLEFGLNIDTLIDFEGSLDRPECVVEGTITEFDGNKADKPFLVPAKPGCMRTTNLASPDDYLHQDDAGTGLVQKVYLYLDAETKNQYFTAISGI